MITKAKIISQYVNSKPQERVEIILSNYDNFLAIVDGYVEVLRYTISYQKAYNRKNHDEIGIRIKKSGNSDSTGNQAVENVMIKDAILESSLDEDVFQDLDENEMTEVRNDVIILKMMRFEYTLVKAQLEALNAKEKKLIQEGIIQNKDVKEIADSLDILYETARSRIRFAKKSLLSSVVPFLKENILLEEKNNE